MSMTWPDKVVSCEPPMHSIPFWHLHDIELLVWATAMCIVITAENGLVLTQYCSACAGCESFVRSCCLAS